MATRRKDSTVRVSPKGNHVYPEKMDIISADLTDADENLNKEDKNAAYSLTSNGPEKLHDLLRPTLMLLAICGCYTFQHRSNHSERNSLKWKIIEFASGAYRMLCFFVCLLFIAKDIAAMMLSQTSLDFKILLTVWHLQCLSAFLIFTKADSRKFGHFTTATHLWDTKVIPAMECLNIHMNEVKFRKQQKIYVILAVSLTVLNVATITLAASPLLSNQDDDYIVSPFPYTIPLSIIFMTIALPLTFLHTFAFFYVCTISTLLTNAFEAYNKFLQKYFSKTLSSKTCKINSLRLLHLNLCKLVSEFDSDLGYYYASSFVFCIGIACYILYQVIKISMSTTRVCMFLFWLVSQLGFLSAMSVFAAYVNEAAHESLDTIYYLSIPDINTEQLGQLNLFIFKLIGSPVGFTTAGLLTITKEFLLTITGVFLTYFFLLYTLP